MYILQLTFHRERTQPLSDLVRKGPAKFYLTSETSIQVYVSVMSSRGLTHFDLVQLTKTPYEVPYEPPLGSDWSVLQIQAVTPLELDETPYSIDLKYTY